MNRRLNFFRKAGPDRAGPRVRAALTLKPPPHSLRHTYNTFMPSGGVPIRFAMKQMRYSDIELTSKVYLDEQHLPVYDAIKNLPRLFSDEEYTQIRAQILGARGQEGPQVVASDPPSATLAVLGVDLLGRGVTQGDAEAKLGGPSRI